MNFTRSMSLVMIALGFLLSGCSTLNVGAQSPRELSLENAWTRATTTKESLGYRRTNQMAPIVLEDRVIQGNAIDGIVAYDRKNGAQIWRIDIENGVEGGAAIAGDKIYFGASDGQFYSASVKDGQIFWTYPVRAETLAPPTVSDGVVYFQSGADVVYALDAETGRQLWTYNRQVTSQLSIRATTRPVISGESLYVGFSDGFLVSLKRRDGVFNC